MNDEDGRRIALSANTLKYIAIIAMFFDHFFAGFLPQYGLLRIPGRIVMPIMCFFISEGFFHTSDIRKYIARLLVFSLISHFVYDWYFQLAWWKATSAMWGLTLGLVALTAVKNERLNVAVKAAVVLACCLLAYPADWKFVPVLWILAFGVFRGQFKKQVLAFTVIGLLVYILPAVIRLGWEHIYQYGIFLAIPLLALYSGKRGRKSALLKWGFYVFYPLHLLVLCIIKYFMGI